MRLVVSLLALGCVCLGVTGCALFDKNKSSKDSPASTKGSSGPSKAPSGGDPLLGGSGGTGAAPAPPPAANPFGAANKAGDAPVDPGGILAGRVVDSYDRPQGSAHVRWVCMDEKDQEARDVSVNPDGFFVIQGLRPGANYKLHARAKNGETILSGIKYASVPNSRMVIQIDKDFTGSDTPPIPGAPALPGKNEKSARNMGNDPFSNDSATFGNNRSPSGGTIPVNYEPELPVVVRVPSVSSTVSMPSPPPPANSGGWTPTPPAGGGWSPATETPRSWPPTTEIRGPQTKPSSELQKPWPAVEIQPVPVPPAFGEDPLPKFPDSGPSSGLEGPPGGPARVPSCVLVGGRLQNLALKDINGEPWEFRQHHGKVVLLDFWATYCAPCQRTMPKLRALQSRFGSSLEIVGIAYEAGGSPQEQAHRVNTLCQSMQINYRQLLGAGPQCPVSNQFRVTGLPTLVLLDANGVILWRHVGEMDRGELEELERRIARQVN